MVNIGIICEYNPFHNGHLYHIRKIKELFPESTITAILSGNFTQRGIPSILSKDEKSKIALNHGIDLVIELPFQFASQSADIFAYGAVQILNKLNIDYLIFGSESNDLESLKKYAEIQVNDKEYNKRVKSFLDEGLNYPTAMAKALCKGNINMPNDLLGISYLKALKETNSNIVPICIKRTNDYHSNELYKISSATAIRNAIKNNINIKNTVPNDTYEILKSKKEIDYFSLLKYKIISENKSINKYLTVDEGIENRILKVINQCDCIDDLINKVKTKRYTYNKLSRMFIHILCSFTKEEAKLNNNIKYISVLGFNENGKHILNTVKKNIDVPIITTKKYYLDLLELQERIDNIYNLITKNYF